MRQLFVILCLTLIGQANFAQKILEQNLKGQVIENSTGQPLIGANVYILDSNPLIGTSTDENGYYKFENLLVGRYRISCSYLGYKSFISRSILLTTGKEFVQDINMEEDLLTIDVEISALSSDESKVDQSSSVSLQKFNSELASRYAGSRNDVARMAAGFAGVSASDDSRNDIIIRGNSPSGLLWRLNGIDIPNPSHFGALGATGGPVSMLNNNLLNNSTFITGAFPAKYGNALSGVFDLTMKKGNKDKIEGLFGIGFNGFEGGLEGPLGKKGGSFILNYRYSVIDLISKLGGSASSGTGDAIPRYQDLSFNINLPTENIGSFSLFGLGGNSGIDFISDITESENPNLYTDSNENLYYKTNTSVIGINNKHYFNNHSFGKLSLSYSSSNVNTIVDTVSNSFNITPLYRDDSSQDRIQLTYSYKNKINKKQSLLMGASFNKLEFNFLDSVRTIQNYFKTLRNFNGSSYLSQFSIQWQQKFNNKLSLDLGIFGQQFSFNDSKSIEPRLNISYKFNSRFSLNLGMGRHSKLQDYQLYLVKTKLEDGSYIETNKNLEMTKSNQIVTGFKWQVTKDWSLKSELYYQNLSDIPIETLPSNFSAINSGADFTIPSQDSLVNGGYGTNYGFELTVEKDFEKGFYALATLSVFKSTYTGSDGITYSTAFDNKYVSNLLAGKEIKLNKSFTLSLDTKITMAGGRRFTPLDLNSSILEGEAVKTKTSAFENQFDDYFRTDLKISLKENKKKLSHAWSLDFQNLFNTENVFGETFDARNQEIDITNQLGFYTVIEYKLTF